MSVFEDFTGRKKRSANRFQPTALRAAAEPERWAGAGWHFAAEVAFKAMSWFRASSLVFGLWAVVCVILPGLTKEIAGVGYVRSGHAEDWTQIVGLFCLAFVVLLDQAHRSQDARVRRNVARGVLTFTLPCAFLMSYWQLMPERRWFRLDNGDIVLLFLVSYGMLQHADVGGRAKS